MAKRKPQHYLVKDDTTVRAAPDGPDEWIQYHAGDVVTDPPKHADVEGWLESGHWEASDAEVTE